MRTTLNIDQGALEMVREMADQRNISVGEAASFLIMRGLATAMSVRMKNGFALFNVELDTPTFGPAEVEHAEQREDREFEGFFTRPSANGPSA